MCVWGGVCGRLGPGLKFGEKFKHQTDVDRVQLIGGESAVKQELQHPYATPGWFLIDQLPYWIIP